MRAILLFASVFASCTYFTGPPDNPDWDKPPCDGHWIDWPTELCLYTICRDGVVTDDSKPDGFPCEFENEEGFCQNGSCQSKSTNHSNQSR